MEIILYSEFSKRTDSTKNPESGGIVVSVTKQVVLKDNCSVIKPSFFLADTNGYVYCKWRGWYYFITNDAYDINGAHYIDCEIDVLGTWRQAILGTYAFVEYSSSNFDANIIDDRIAQEVTNNYTVTVEEGIFTNNGCYVLTTTNNSPLYGGTTNWILTEANLKQVLTNLIDDDSAWGSLEQLFSDVSGGLMSCRYVPIPYSYFESTDADYVRIGDYIDADGFAYITDGRVHESVTLSIPWYYSDFRRHSSFTRMILALPFIGCVDLDATELIGASDLQVTMEGNVVTGVISYRIAVNGHYLNTYNGSFGRSIPIGTSQMDINGALNGLATQASGVVGGALATSAMELGLATTPMGQFGLVAGAVTSASQLMRGVLQSTMSLHTSDFRHYGGFSGGYGERIINQYYLIGISKTSRTDPSELTNLYGRPCYKVAQIGTLSGYVKTSGFSIDISAMDVIKKAINSAMDKGVYLE